MQDAGKHTYGEILSQPRAWRETLELVNHRADDIAAFWARSPRPLTLFTGCGSTHYLALAAASALQQMTGQMARGCPASELWLNPQGSYPAQGDVLLVAVSRSGETTETIRAVERFKAAGRGDVITVTCYDGCTLSALGDLNLVLPWAGEESIAQTRSFSSMFVTTTAMAAICGGQGDLLSSMQGLPAAARALLDQYGDGAQGLGGKAGIDRFYFLGSGALYGLACEVSLKMKEMSLSHSEPFHFLEFRHGPKSMANEQALIIGLVAEGRAVQERRVLNESLGQGARILALAEKPVIEASSAFSLNSGVAEAVRGPLYLPLLQLVAYGRAVAKGLDPDKPTNLTAVVELDA